MSEETRPICHVVSGPNGFWKSTFALRYLPEYAGAVEYVNPDLIAQFKAAGLELTPDVWERLAADRNQALEGDLAWIHP